MKRSISILLSLSLLLSAFLLTTASAAEAEWVENDEEWIEAVPAYQEIASLSASFSQEEIDDPNIWYADPDHVVTLSAAGTTVTDSAYRRLINAIQAAPAHQVTHIIIPFHINVGNVNTTTFTVVGVRDGATVVLIGAHPVAENGQSVISDTHGNNGLTRTFRVRGDGAEHSGLVLRNIILQTAAQAAASTPATAPAPLALTQQTGNARGGGVAIEPGAVTGVTGAGGGGHLILCRDGVIRNSTTDNNGPVDIQTDGRFTMMPGAEMHTNAAANSGGAVHVNTRGTFTMHGGVIRDNLARGERIDAGQAMQRAVGGAIFVQNGGTFNMYDGEIFRNRARLNEIAAAPTATNAIVTSSGGGVFVTGAASTFNMYGGTIRDNEAIRTRTSGLATGTGAAAVNNRNAYRAGNGGGVYLTGGATFHMRGGTIRDNTVTNEGAVISTGAAVNGLNLCRGGGVYLTGTGTSFVMHGGEITSNQVLQTVAGPIRGGGGVAIDAGAVFELHNGEITWNTATATETQIYQGGGGVLVGGDTGTATSYFFMHGGKIANNTATHAVNPQDVGAGEGGGVFVSPRGDFTMYGGSITDNFARSNGRGGGGVFVLGGRFTTANPTDTVGNVIEVTEKIIENNRARGGGGGIMALRTDPSPGVTIPGGIAGEVTIVEGTIIRNNRAGLTEDITNGAGLGGGIHMRWGGNLIITGGEIYNNTSLRPGGGVAVGHDTLDGTIVVTMSGGKIFDNHARGDIATAVGADRGNGGGISVAGASTWNMTGGEITDNKADNNGGGVCVGGGVFNMQDGSITNNIANDGGGLFVPHANLGNVTINSASIFYHNVARNGVRIDNALAAAHSGRIRPGTVSVNWIPELIGAPPHAFTNFDINADGPGLWRITYATGAHPGDILARVSGTDTPVPSGVFVLEDTRIQFDAKPAMLFDWWDLGTREQENAEFVYESGGRAPSLVHTVVRHTHIVGNFLEEFSITYDPNGGAGDPYVQRLPAGSHTVTHTANRPDEYGLPFQFLGWNTASDGSGTFYAPGDAIDIGADVILYAQWGQEKTTLSVSKTVTDDFGDLTLAFEFAIRFLGTDANPLPAGTQFPYTGPGDGILTLDSDGTATFWLSHGQTIAIAQVPVGIYIQIIETPDVHYETTFTDSEQAHDSFFGNDTQNQKIAENHAFHFYNERIVAPPMGVTLGHMGAFLLLPALAILSATAGGILKSFLRKAPFRV
ncbi:MAG: InlB B-repeat-containing protein [Oscillospiraceae bacterium]|nr:InlB B-repeat-containing protein [Oscillospiraceae bacterium]